MVICCLIGEVSISVKHDSSSREGGRFLVCYEVDCENCANQMFGWNDKGKFVN